MQISTIKKYLSLMKFGILFGNTFPLLAGFVLAGGKISFLMLNTAVFGLFIMGCGCVLNNCYDAKIDRLMQRTKNRVLPQKLLPISFAILFGLSLGIVSVIWGMLFLNTKTLVAGLVGLFFYTVVYTILTKRNSGFGVHFGSISGAIPPIIGYLSYANGLHLPAILLFFVLIFWQMPHSFAIEIFRYEDFSSAKIKTVPSCRGIKWVKYSMIVYILLYITCNVALWYYTNPLHWVASGILGLWWLWVVVGGFKLENTFSKSTKWARRVFFLSIINMMVVSIAIILQGVA